MAFNFEINPVAINNISKTLENLKDSLKLQDKTVEIDSNGQEIITADSEYDGLGKVTINTDVPTKPEEVLTETITENGLKTFNPTAGSVYSSASITVNVPEKKIEAEKTVSITENKETIITPTPDNAGMARVVVTTNIPQPTLEENKTQTISSNSVVEVTPSAGNDGMKKATITVNVPEKKIEANKTQSIVTNGETVITPTEGNDGMAKVTVNVNVPTGGTEYRTSKGIAFPKFLLSEWTEQKEIADNLIIDSDDVSYLFYYPNSGEGLMESPITLDFNGVTKASYFMGIQSQSASSASTTGTVTLNNCDSLKTCDYMFYNVWVLSTLRFNYTESQKIKAENMFYGAIIHNIENLPTIDGLSFSSTFGGSRCNWTSPITIDANNGITASYTFQSFKGTEISDINIIVSGSGTRTGVMSNFIVDCDNLETIGLINFSEKLNVTPLRFIANCPNLTTIKGFVNWNRDLDIMDSPKLSNASIQNLIDNAADVTSLGTRTMTFNATPFATITEEQRAAATAKGWTLASA